MDWEIYHQICLLCKALLPLAMAISDTLSYMPRVLGTTQETKPKAFREAADTHLGTEYVDAPDPHGPLLPMPDWFVWTCEGKDNRNTEEHLKHRQRPLTVGLLGTPHGKLRPTSTDSGMDYGSWDMEYGI